MNDQSSEISVLYWRKEEWVSLIIRAERNHWQVGNACSWASQVAQWWRICLSVQDMQKLWVWALGQEDSLEEDLATHSSIPAWEILWTEEPVRLQSVGSQRLRHQLGTEYIHHTCYEKRTPGGRRQGSAGKLGRPSRKWTDSLREQTPSGGNKIIAFCFWLVGFPFIHLRGLTLVLPWLAV